MIDSSLIHVQQHAVKDPKTTNNLVVWAFTWTGWSQKSIAFVDDTEGRPRYLKLIAGHKGHDGCIAVVDDMFAAIQKEQVFL